MLNRHVREHCLLGLGLVLVLEALIDTAREQRLR